MGHVPSLFAPIKRQTSSPCLFVTDMSLRVPGRPESYPFIENAQNDQHVSVTIPTRSSHDHRSSAVERNSWCTSVKKLKGRQRRKFPVCPKAQQSQPARSRSHRTLCLVGSKGGFSWSGGSRFGRTTCQAMVSSKQLPLTMEKISVHTYIRQHFDGDKQY